MKVKRIFFNGEPFATCIKSSQADTYNCVLDKSDDFDVMELKFVDTDISIDEGRNKFWQLDLTGYDDETV